ncbi:MAG: T9SS type A sorting domain-containing protein, partial [Bacteroidota bacterium]
ISYRGFNYPTLPWQLNRPSVGCQKIGSEYYLVAEPGHPAYRWSNGETTSSIQITDTGDYWVFVPYGTGYLSSEHIIITDITNPCLFLGTPSEVTPNDIILRIIPNPATDHARVLFHLPSNSQVIISLSTLAGINVFHADPVNYSAGDHEVTMDVSALNRGIYFLSMVSDDTRIVRKMIIR